MSSVERAPPLGRLDRESGTSVEVGVDGRWDRTVPRPDAFSENEPDRMTAVPRERSEESDRLVDRLASLDEYRMARRSAQRAAAPEPKPLTVTDALPLEAFSALLAYRDAPQKIAIPPVEVENVAAPASAPVLPAVEADPLQSASRLVILMREQRSLIERLAETTDQSADAPQNDAAPTTPADPEAPVAFDASEFPEPYIPDTALAEDDAMLDQIPHSAVENDDAYVPLDPPRARTAEEIIRALSGVDQPVSEAVEETEELPPPEEPLARYEARHSLAGDLPPGTVMEVPPPSVPAPALEPEFPFVGLNREAEVTIHVGGSAAVLPHQVPVVQLEAERAALLADVERPPMIIERAQAQLGAAAAIPLAPVSQHSPVPGFLFGLSLSLAAGALLFVMLQPV